MRPLRLLPLLCLVAPVACDRGIGAPSSLATREVVDGVEWLRYPESGVPRLAWGFDTLAVIGDAMAEESEYQFDQVTAEGLAGDASGNLFVLDRLGQRVLKFDGRGEHLATYGRPGGGPGELGAPLAMALGPGDSVWVADVGNQRMTVYPPAGGEPRSLPLELERGFPDAGLHVDRWGIVQAFRPMGLMRRGGAGGEAGEERIPLLRMDHGGRVLDTLYRAAPPRRTVQRSGSGGAVAVRMMAHAFAPQLRWAGFSDGGVVVSDTAEYVLSLIGPDGTLRRRIQRDPPARAVTEEDRRAEIERRRSQQPGGGVRVAVEGGRVEAGMGRREPGGPSIRPPVDNLSFEPVVPRILDLRVDRSDRIWIGVSLESPYEVERVDVYDREGNLLGEIHGGTVPDVFLANGLAADLSRDELDVQRISILRLNEGGR